jgi:hypothetical protein
MRWSFDAKNPVLTFDDGRRLPAITYKESSTEAGSGRDPVDMLLPEAKWSTVV